MPRLQNISKYWVSRRSAALASLNAYSMLVPSYGACCTLFTTVGAGMPAASRTVGAMSMTWQNCDRTSPFALMPFGQCTIVPLRVPPKCDATCLVH